MSDDEHNRFTSLSARRAWIEMLSCCVQNIRQGVALRKESVDRNLLGDFGSVGGRQSLSARRAWIEIRLKWASVPMGAVALRKESVDRNLTVSM